MLIGRFQSERPTLALRWAKKGGALKKMLSNSLNFLKDTFYSIDPGAYV